MAFQFQFVISLQKENRDQPNDGNKSDAVYGYSCNLGDCALLEKMSEKQLDFLFCLFKLFIYYSA